MNTKRQTKKTGIQIKKNVFTKMRRIENCAYQNGVGTKTFEIGIK